jgi:hypothetical protein
MGETARQYVIENFDAERICLPQMRRFLGVEQETPAQPDVLVSPENSQPVLSTKDLLRNLLRELNSSGT